MPTVTETKFLTLLKASNPEMKESRAKTIEEETKLAYTRFVEDTELAIRKIEREVDAGVNSGCKTWCAASFIDKDVRTQKHLKALRETVEVSNARIAILF